MEFLCCLWLWSISSDCTHDPAAPDSRIFWLLCMYQIWAKKWMWKTVSSSSIRSSSYETLLIYTLKYFYMCLQSSDLQPEWGQNRIKWGGNLICFVWIISQETCKIAAICITAKYIFANSCLQLHSLHNNSRKVVNGLELDTEHCNVLTLWDLLTNFRVKTILMALNFNNVYSGSNMNVYHIIIDVNCLSRSVVRSSMI